MNSDILAAVFISWGGVAFANFVDSLQRRLERKSRLKGHSAAPVITRDPDGPDVLDAWVYGGGIPALREAALERARGLYGPDAQLEVERVGHIGTSSSSDGRFCTHVIVRCLNFPEEDQ